MTHVTQDGDDVAYEPLLAIALDSFDRAIAAINAYVDDIERRGTIDPFEFERLASDVATAFRFAFEERKRVEEYRKEKATAELGLSIDFDDARAEIGRRLDRLRAAR